MLARHTLPIEWFDTVAQGRGTPEITRYFWKTERSRRLLLLRTLLDTVTDDPSLAGPLPPVKELAGVFEAAQKAEPEAFLDLLMHPQVGSSMAYVLRRHRGGASGSVPFWVDLGTIHLIALVAAAKCGVDWATQVPGRHGTVMLPGLGMARLTETPAQVVVDASVRGGRIELRHDGRTVDVPPTAGSGDDTTRHDGDRWLPLRKVSVGDDLRLTVWLDDLDPFRDLADPEPPARLAPDAFDRWTGLLGAAWSLLCRDHRHSAEALADGVVSLVPLKPEPGWDTRSASNGEAFGSVLVSEPPDATTLAVSLVHEFQHIKLGALMHLFHLTEEDDGSLYYAPWRDDPRPLAGLLQGIYAFFGIAEFWRRHRLSVTGRDRLLAEFDYLYARGQTVEALRSVRRAPALTGKGRAVIDGLERSAADWAADQTDPEVVRLTTLTADCHRVGWRLRHFVADPADVTALTRAWLAREPATAIAPAISAPHPVLRWAQRIPTFVRRRLFDDDGLSGSASPLAAADRYLVMGEPFAARAAYLEWIDAGPEDADDSILAWTGLALALGRTGADRAADALAQRPDLVRSVYGALRASGVAADPVAVAGWLAPVLSDSGS
ncbi:HEXXH motif domain-containing protein [Virgisporangium aliadipatigenens]|uniref:HEXXH motif domain-containing protein n=1 Tax=Virgisporangium aliadipatigenens TaxID=741659 RepID=A0A8J3YRL7_9ACTN|nr:HEXXH motif domain-containing protein [Virgisporangium aliadipatigenens]